MWDFSTDPEFQAQLDWMDGFVRDRIEPLDALFGSLTYHSVAEPLRTMIGGLKAEVLMSIPHGPNVIHSLALQDGTEIKATEPRHGSVVDPADSGSVFATPDTKRLHVFPEEDAQPDFKANPET